MASERVSVALDQIEGRALDWAVAVIEHGPDLRAIQSMLDGGYSPSTDWCHGGPIVERLIRKGAKLYLDVNGWPTCFDITRNRGWRASTSLAAAMRCHAALRFGSHLEVPAHWVASDEPRY